MSYPYPNQIIPEWCRLPVDGHRSANYCRKLETRYGLLGSVLRHGRSECMDCEHHDMDYCMTTRSEWGREHDRCFLCGHFSLYHLETHEIPRGVHRPKGLLWPACWIRACGPLGNNCHEKHLDGMSVVEQLAIKKWRDEGTYNRVLVNVLRGEQPGSITEAKVDAAVAALKGD